MIFVIDLFRFQRNDIKFRFPERPLPITDCKMPHCNNEKEMPIINSAANSKTAQTNRCTTIICECSVVHFSNKPTNDFSSAH